jgi:hypothetical protein
MKTVKELYWRSVSSIKQGALLSESFEVTKGLARVAVCHQPNLNLFGKSLKYVEEEMLCYGV